MASQITHIVYGEKALITILKHRKVNERDFYLGTTFPDIRYMGAIERDKTHDSAISLPVLMEAKTDFELGYRLHSYVDLERERLIRRTGVYKRLGKVPMLGVAMKFLEDEAVYDLFTDWERIIGFYGEILAEEKALVAEEVVSRWHLKLQSYFSNPPTIEAALGLISGTIITEEQFKRGSQLVEQLRQDEEVMTAIESVYYSIFEE